MTSPSNQQFIRWLHLSDFHLKGKDTWSQDVVLKSLLKDISNRYSGSTFIDFIFITGDLAFSGKCEEYLILEDFLKQLLTITRVPADKLFMVPGNHDIDRDIEMDAFFGARQILKNSIEVDRFIGDEGRRRTLFRRQSAFRNFCNRICKYDLYSDSSYQHFCNHNIHGLNVSVLLIDSSWLSEGGQTDAHSILVGEKQLIDISPRPPASTLTIGLMHHPLDWLAPFDRMAIKNLLSEHCHLLFRGHVHEDSVQTISQSGNHLQVFTAGASYENRLSANCYGYGFIDLYTGNGECAVHKYRNDTKTWNKQEPIPWTVTNHDNFSIELENIHNVIKTLVLPYPNYLSCLVGRKVSEIPILHGEQVVFITFTDPMAHSTLLAESIRQLRFLFQWKDCWDPKRWRVAIDNAVDLYSRSMGIYKRHKDSRPLLLGREEQCTRIVDAINQSSGPTRYTNQTIVQAMELIDRGALTLASYILERLLCQNGVSDAEVIISLRILAKIYLAEDDTAKSLKAVESLLQFNDVTGADYVLATTCFFNAGEFIRASKYLTEANKLGVPFSQLQGIATSVAGQTGDTDLLIRLRKSDV